MLKINEKWDEENNIITLEILTFTEKRKKLIDRKKYACKMYESDYFINIIVNDKHCPFFDFTPILYSYLYNQL